MFMNTQRTAQSSCFWRSPNICRHSLRYNAKRRKSATESQLGPRPPHPNDAARMIMIRMTAKINKRQHMRPLAAFWYLLAVLSSWSAPRVSVTVFVTLFSIMSSCAPCWPTICATSRNSSFSSPTLCSMFRISDSRSMISDSWKSTSSCGAKRSCSCCCCCCAGSSEYLGSPEVSPDSMAARAPVADCLCFSSARRCIDWNSEPDA